MKKILGIGSLLLSQLFGATPLYSQGTRLAVQGQIMDSKTRQPIIQAKISLRSNSLKATREIFTSESGYFSFDPVYLGRSFSLDISQPNYQGTSRSFNIQQESAVFNVGIIYLEPTSPPSPPSSTPPTPVDTAVFVKATLLDNGILATNGARDLFYSLNPELQNQSKVPANYKVRLPVFPKKDMQKEKQFNEQFKLDKKKDPSLFSLNNNTTMPGATPAVFQPNSQGPLNGAGNSFNLNKLQPYADIEKFVFVLYKKDQLGNIITTGNEVEGRFLVYYYGEYKEGDTSVYHKSRDATYGYATMAKASYKIIVIDQDTRQQMRISDPVINTVEYFDRTPTILKLFNIHPSWIKIPIRFYE